MDEKKNKIGILYKNLDHASSAYFAAESVFPVWEAAFALIVGQLIVAYFNPAICNYQQIQLAIIGVIISFIWFILVSLNYQNALYIDEEMKILLERLNKELKSETCLSIDDLIYPWVKDDDKRTWTRRNIFLGVRKDKNFDFGKALKSTWFYRRVLPFILVLIWILLFAGQIWSFAVSS